MESSRKKQSIKKWFAVILTVVSLILCGLLAYGMFLRSLSPPWPDSPTVPVDLELTETPLPMDAVGPEHGFYHVLSIDRDFGRIFYDQGGGADASCFFDFRETPETIDALTNLASVASTNASALLALFGKAARGSWKETLEWTDGEYLSGLKDAQKIIFYHVDQLAADGQWDAFLAGLDDYYQVGQHLVPAGGYLLHMYGASTLARYADYMNWLSKMRPVPAPVARALQKRLLAVGEGPSPLPGVVKQGWREAEHWLGDIFATRLLDASDVLAFGMCPDSPIIVHRLRGSSLVKTTRHLEALYKWSYLEVQGPYTASTVGGDFREAMVDPNSYCRGITDKQRFGSDPIGRMFAGGPPWKPWWRTVGLARGVALALAIDRFEREQGRLPTSLKALIPEYIDALPVDPVHPGGGSFRYHVRSAGGYSLYGVGANQVDDSSARPAFPDEGKDLRIRPLLPPLLTE